MHVHGMSCSSISLIKHTRSFITAGLISPGKCWGCSFGGDTPSSCSRSYDHPFWTETINPVFSHCSVSLKRIFNSLLIDCWKLNACQFEGVLESFKKCSVCKTEWLLVQIGHCHNRKILEICTYVIGIDYIRAVYILLCVGFSSLTYYWQIIYECSFKDVCSSVCSSVEFQ